MTERIISQTSAGVPGNPTCLVPVQQSLPARHREAAGLGTIRQDISVTDSLLRRIAPNPSLTVLVKHPVREPSAVRVQVWVHNDYRCGIPGVGRRIFKMGARSCD